MHVRCMYRYIYIIHDCVAPFSINLEVVAANTCNYGLGVELIEDGSISSKMTGICPLINLHNPSPNHGESAFFMGKSTITGSLQCYVKCPEAISSISPGTR